MFGGMFPLQPYEWIEEDVNWRLRSNAPRNGFVVEIAAAADYASFEAFKRQILSNRLDASHFADEARVAYTKSSGETLEFAYPDERLLNGSLVDLSGTPLFDGPHLQGDGSAQRLVVTHGGMRHVIDLAETPETP